MIGLRYCYYVWRTRAAPPGPRTIKKKKKKDREESVKFIGLKKGFSMIMLHLVGQILYSLFRRKIKAKMIP